ncbi:hypothetical protein D3C72_1196900 [compost metagenome]
MRKRSKVPRAVKVADVTRQPYATFHRLRRSISAARMGLALTSMSNSDPLSARVSQRAMGGLSSGSSTVKAVHSSQLPEERDSRLPNSGYHSSAWLLAMPMLTSPSMPSLSRSVRRVNTSVSRAKPFFSSMPISRMCSGITPPTNR